MFLQVPRQKASKELHASMEVSALDETIGLGVKTIENRGFP